MRTSVAFVAVGAAFLTLAPAAGQAQVYSPQLRVVAGNVRAFPGEQMTGTLIWQGRRTPIYSQNDPRWANRRLGVSPMAMRSYGCFMAVAAMARNLLGQTTSIRQILWLSSRDATFEKSGAITYDSIKDTLFPDHDVRFVRTDPIAVLGPTNDSVILLKLNMTPKAAKMREHWLLYLGPAGSDFFVFDPDDGGIHKLRERYGRSLSVDDRETLNTVLLAACVISVREEVPAS